MRTASPGNLRLQCSEQAQDTAGGVDPNTGGSPVLGEMTGPFNHLCFLRLISVFECLGKKSIFNSLFLFFSRERSLELEGKKISKQTKELLAKILIDSPWRLIARLLLASTWALKLAFLTILQKGSFLRILSIKRLRFCLQFRDGRPANTI